MRRSAILAAGDVGSSGAAEAPSTPEAAAASPPNLKVPY